MANSIDIGRKSSDVDVVATYVREVIDALQALDLDAVRTVVDRLMDAWRRGATIFIIGNGGSASTASHMMNDLCKFASVAGLPRLRAIALTDNVSLITAVSNDASYADVFVEPLRNLMRPGDLVVAISGSGNSINVVNAALYALENDATVIGLCGTPGGRLAALSSCRIMIPAVHIGQQEDGHLVVNHAIATALRQRILATTDARTTALA